MPDELDRIQADQFAAIEQAFEAIVKAIQDGFDKTKREIRDAFSKDRRQVPSMPTDPEKYEREFARRFPGYEAGYVGRTMSPEECAKRYGN